MVLIILSQFSVFQYINHIKQKTKNVNVYTIFICELNKRIDEIKIHSMNNSFFVCYEKENK